MHAIIRKGNGEYYTSALFHQEELLYFVLRGVLMEPGSCQSAGIYGGVEVRKRTGFAILFMILLATEILIGMYATGWVRSYLGDVLVVILLYAFARLVSPEKPARRFILPTVILVFAFLVEFLQLWGFCDRFGITNRLLRIIIGTGFSVIDILSYTIGIVPCYMIDYFVTVRMKKRED